MRVVSGDKKGLSLKAVPGTTTRPTTDKVKEAIFNMIGPYFDGGIGLDLFGGSGGLGIEALSRGLQSMIFVDRDGKAIRTIKENLNFCKLTDRAEVYRNDAERALKAIEKRELHFDLIMLDPPYKAQKLLHLMEGIQKRHLLKEEGIIMAEHENNVELPEVIGKLHRVKKEVYGLTVISIYKHV
ncbi:16S rRNA (guanine(966)-N(2))-methyltransferase RsmD [Priestia endophytica]|jgi:16S rRNA (guanine(966)-N(2))-methyltransferase RsmD|uniref:16S rRNA (Guanine(966)-N(2))-methyltransferase RsmD n=1 Tax=Priestia endophytica TaxID=135735 RepID=A0AAX1QB58_9BACI|nr:16S rRNA (guanine(966)-N(2))-methyltransferase RsmD [Priestia endophytica]RAS79400.1 16S rRNA (guanine(966)-N(2))-methyltransferase RsmD [Priestia endophytica]RAS84073.1 16S rRNA (guanine(966)-N(2))-methyltransferase RsmD [Priestia endophytica]